MGRSPEDKQAWQTETLSLTNDVLCGSPISAWRQEGDEEGS